MIIGRPALTAKGWAAGPAHLGRLADLHLPSRDLMQLKRRYGRDDDIFLQNGLSLRPSSFPRSADFILCIYIDHDDIMRNIWGVGRQISRGVGPLTFVMQIRLTV